MNLADKYLPRYQFSERHDLRIAAPQAAVMAAVLSYRPETDCLFRCAIAARELPMRALNVLKGQRKQTQAAFGLDNFSLLERCADQEVAYALAGKFWQLNYGQAPVAHGDAFLAYQAPGAAKLLLTFRAEALDDAHTHLVTETRVLCLDRSALLRFTPYWYAIRPVSGLIRRRILAAIGGSTARSHHADA